MSEIPLITIVVVTVAALFYCVERLSKAFAAVNIALFSAYARSVGNLHTATFNDIKPTFEFWWQGAPSLAARAAVLGEFPPEIVESIPQVLVDSMVDLPVERYRLVALHLAAHANMGEKEEILLNRLPKLRGIRALALKQYAEHQEQLAKERLVLLSAGINVEELEANFVPSK